ncbi:MAG: sodium-dependent bicarbonate transport family permease [Actinomycetota bacterium]|nr:sodium-dependent bicarbonate transport family permease [Actinomycetota bacterium]MDA3002260.1 sodium-dependent bicarbonate transport family permease [Actinomycetota bacterium]
MPLSELVVDNLTSPAVLAFVLGVLAVAIRGDLRLPDQVSSLISVYLLLAIGIKGGTRLREADVADIWGPVLATLALGVITPIVAFVTARWFGRLNTTNAASLAAHYGSVSAVTFTAAEAFNKNSGILEEGFLPALVAILEIPGIVVALVIASRHLGSTVKTALHEVLTGKSILLLGGGLLIGGVGSREAVTAIEPFFITLFPGFLCLFLLDLGTLAGQRFTYVRRAGIRLVALAVALPILFGVLGTFVGTIAGLSAGGAAVLAIMAASASYIAAPAAVRVALPEADLGVSLGAAIGVTFPFNLVIGIPVFSELAQRIA